MRGRSHGVPPTARCLGCQLPHPLCICKSLPALSTKTRVILILHQLEALKPSNSGRLAVRCLPNSSIVMRGRFPAGQAGRPDPTGIGPPIPHVIASAVTESDAPDPWLAQAVNPVLLYPHDDAVPIESFRGANPPVTLIVPDGTWRQASSTRARVSGLSQIPCATLPPGMPSQYQLRHSDVPGRISTMEAIARSLGILEDDPAVQQALESALAMMVDRTLFLRGKRARPFPAPDPAFK